MHQKDARRSRTWACHLKEIVELHGGTITAESAEDKIRFTLI
ncbi:MAG: cell wall metabolism sensor histidine kinase WalK [Eubacterium sp.]|nr:cell wall metabolism sensor histidine kinase WalK [Eubacterium sp.]